MSKQKGKKQKLRILWMLIKSIHYAAIIQFIAGTVFIICAGTLLDYAWDSYQNQKMEEKLNTLLVQNDIESEEEPENSYDSSLQTIYNDSTTSNVEQGLQSKPTANDDNIITMEQQNTYEERLEEIENELHSLELELNTYEYKYDPETIRILTGGAYYIYSGCQDEELKSSQEDILEQITILNAEKYSIQMTLENCNAAVTNTSAIVENGVRIKQESAIRKFQVLLNVNEDFYGWLTIGNTAIDLPVVIASDNEYYLTHNFYKEESKYGTLFLDCVSNIEIPSRNLIVYGHNMSDGSMFHDLLNYKDKLFYQENKTFIFDTIYGQETYEVVAAFYSQVYQIKDNVFKYYQYTDPTIEEMDVFLQGIRELSLYKTEAECTTEDNYLTLSTCAYHKKNGRFVVVARKIE